MPYELPPWPQVVAHRGASGHAPENTLAAIEKAIDAEADMVEVDVKLSLDGIPMLMHSRTLDQTTDGRGLLEDHTCEELRRLDAGTWFDTAFAGQQVPLLAESISLARGRIAMNLDLKSVSALQPVIELVREAHTEDRVVITGCSAECVRQARKIAPEITTLLNLDEMLVDVELGDAATVARSAITVAAELGSAAVNVHHSLVDRGLIRLADAKGIGVWVFTVDDEERFRTMVELGVSSITTTWPSRMLAIVRSR